MTESQQSPNIAIVSPIQNQPPIQKAPWPWFSLFVISLILGVPSAIIVVWQNLKRIGKNEVASKFLLISGGLYLLLAIVTQITTLPLSFLSNLGRFLGVIFPVWYYYSYGKSWEKEHSGQTKWSWSLLGWGILGLAIYLVLIVAIRFLLVSLGLSS
jgi:hypothetical protein